MEERCDGNAPDLRPDDAAAEDSEFDALLRRRVASAFDSVSLDEEAKSRMLVELQARQFTNSLSAEDAGDAQHGGTDGEAHVESDGDEGEPKEAGEDSSSQTDENGGGSDSGRGHISQKQRATIYRVVMPIAACLLLVAMIVGVSSMTNRYNESMQGSGAESPEAADRNSYAMDAEQSAGEMAYSESLAPAASADEACKSVEEAAEAPSIPLADYTEVRLEDGTLLDVVVDENGWPLLLEEGDLGDSVGAGVAGGSGVEPLGCEVFKDASRADRYACVFPDGSIVSLERHE